MKVIRNERVVGVVEIADVQVRAEQIGIGRYVRDEKVGGVAIVYEQICRVGIAGYIQNICGVVGRQVRNVLGSRHYVCRVKRVVRDELNVRVGAVEIIVGDELEGVKYSPVSSNLKL